MLAVPALVLTNSLGGFFYYAIPLYQYYPKLLCEGANGNWASCTREQACTAGTNYKFDFSDPETFNNWMTELDLICTPKL